VNVHSSCCSSLHIAATIPFSQTWEGLPSDDEPSMRRDWSKLFLDAAIVPGVTGKTINGVYMGKKSDVENTLSVETEKGARQLNSEA
jgi:hypothetical protein